MSRVLIIAPHADDEVLGVGGTLSRLSTEGNRVVVAIITGHGGDPHPIWPQSYWETIRSEALKAHEILGVDKTIFRELPAVLVPDQPVYVVNKIISDLMAEEKPDILYVPFLYDLHRDHRDLVAACSVAWRSVTEWGRNIKEIYMYETLSETHWNIHSNEGGFLPNVYVDISGEYIMRKLSALSCYESQIKPFPDARSLEAVEALAKFRGCSVSVPAAESFVLVRKIS